MKVEEVTLERVADGNFYALRATDGVFGFMEDKLEETLVKEKSMLVSGLVAPEHIEDPGNDGKVPKFVALVRRQSGTSHDAFVKKLRSILSDFELKETIQDGDGMYRTLDKILTDKQVVCVMQRYFYETTLVCENVRADGCYEEDMVYHLPVEQYYHLDKEKRKAVHVKYALPTECLKRFRLDHETIASAFFSPQADGKYSELAETAGFC